MKRSTREGWGHPVSTRKFHYFRDSRSLCGRWMFTGDLEPDGPKGPDDCAACRRKRDAETNQSDE